MPLSLLIGAETLSTGDKWSISGITTLIGLGMTFLILALLIGTILLMRPILKQLEKILPKVKRKIKEFVRSIFKKSKNNSSEVTAVVANAVVSEPVDNLIDEETMKAIETAVLNYVKKDDNFVKIKSVSVATEQPVAEIAEEAESAPVATKQAASGTGKAVNAPMPGTILKIAVANGKQVKEGELIFVLEAMKMENDIVAPASGIFTATVAEGAKVNTGDLIAEIK